MQINLQQTSINGHDMVDALEIVGRDDIYLYRILPFLKAFYDEFLIELKNKAHLEPLFRACSALPMAASQDFW